MEKKKNGGNIWILLSIEADQTAKEQQSYVQSDPLPNGHERLR